MIRKPFAIEPVWWLSATLGASAAALFVCFGRHYEPIHAPEIAWWTLALLVLVTERWPVELEFRRSSHSFSLTDVPLTLALIFASGTHAFFAIFCGTLVALGLRRLPAVKFAFNLAQFSFVTAVLIVVVHGAASLDPGFGWPTWAAVLLATQLGGVLTIVQILGAIVLTEGHVSRDQVRQMFGMDFVVTITGTAMALVCSILWIERPEAAPLLGIPILVAFLGYRAYVRSARATRRSSSSTRPTARCRSRPRSRTRSTGCSSARSRPSAPSRPRSSCSPPTAARRCAPGSARAARARRWRRSTPASAAALRACAENSDEASRSWHPFPPARSPPTCRSAASVTACSACCAARTA